jgi:TolA-binding protein
MTPAPRRFPGLALALLLACAPTAGAQMTPEQAGNLLLAGARRAYNEKNYTFAAARFQEFLTKHAGHKQYNSARYGLALCHIEGPGRDYAKAALQLNHLAGNKTAPEYRFVLYYLGFAKRGQGIKALETALAKPAEANNHRNLARQLFEDAAKQFAAAAPVFAARAKGAKAPAKGLPLDLEWAVRSRCDQAEMLLRVRKPKEARAAVASLLTDKPTLASRYRQLGLYYHGFACFLLGDSLVAGRSLSLLSPFRDPVFGTHARYLLARVHHTNRRQNEREEAKGHYEGVLKGHAASKKAAEEALRQPDRFKNDPEEKKRLEALTKGPVPDHVARATFFLGVLQYEDGRFGEAQDAFKAFVEQYPASVLASEAKLRQGFCQVQLKQFAAAQKILQPIADKDPLLADQALLWIGKAQAGLADPKKPDTYKTAIETLRKSAERAGQRASATPPDPGGKTRRGEALLEMAEVQQVARLFRDATNTYNLVLNEKLLPDRAEEVLQQLASAWQLAGDYNESDKVCARFQKEHPKSTLLPFVLFRHAENAYFLALAAEKLPNPADRKRDVAKFTDEAIKRYRVVLSKYPEFKHVNLARYGIGVVYYRKGDLEKAKEALEAIPAGDRTGELAAVPYTLADILLRTAPARADDAVAAGKLEETLKNAIDLLDGFAGAQPKAPQTPDALLKLGYCHVRRARLLAQAADKAKALAEARAVYERLQQRFPKHELFSQATFERAKVLDLANDGNGAINELKKFAQDPLEKARIAPLALLHLATLLRKQTKPGEAAEVLAKCRKEHEENLKKDPRRAGWVPLLQYHQAVALREAGKLDQASTLFDAVAKANPDKPEGWESALRSGQNQKDAAEKMLAEGEKRLAAPGLKPEQRVAAEKLITDGTAKLREAARYLSAQSAALKARKPGSDDLARTLGKARSRMLYEAAWAQRTVARREVAAARRKIQLERWQKLRDEAVKRTPSGQTVPAVALPVVTLAEVPVQPAETQAQTEYKALIADFPDVTINADARFELAELLAERDKHADALKLLQDALEKEPPQELTDKIKVRLGTTLLDRGARRLSAARRKLADKALKPADKVAAQKEIAAGKKDLEAALEHIGAVTENSKSPLLAQATYREGECYLLLGKRDEAVKRLAKFRDHGPFQNLAGLSDRALLRLGFVLGEDKKWDASRQAYEALTSRFGSSPWLYEARYGIAWAQQAQGKYDEAVNTYGLVTNALSNELAARAQLNIGLCRLAQKRYADATSALLVVPFTYDYPELSAVALIEAARAYSENKQQAQAIKLLKRVLRDHPDGSAAVAARKRLADLGEG